MNFIQADIFSGQDFGGPYALVYADPPYANCRFKYARRNGSRQWGKDARADYLRELIAIMERHRAPDGACALSIATPELRLMGLFPTTARVAAWVKPYAPFRPGVWPCFAWEPVVIWGRLPNRAEQRQAEHTPKDWLQLSPRVPRKGGHETPKPDAFAAWVLDLTMGPRRGAVLELFGGTCPVAREAEARGLPAAAVDLDDWRVLRQAGLSLSGEAA